MEKRIREGIKSSKVFMVIFTKDYIKNIPKQQVMLAKGLKKPFRVLLQDGLKVPDWFKDGVDDYEEMPIGKELDSKSMNINKMKIFLQPKVS